MIQKSTPGHISVENHDLKGFMHPHIPCSTVSKAKTWKQPKCPSTDKQIKNIRHIHMCVCVQCNITFKRMK